MSLFYLGAGLSGLAAALWIDTPVLFSLALAGIGLFSGIYHPAGLGLIAKKINRVSYAMGFNGMFGNLGLAVAPFLTGIVNWVWGPRSAYILLGGMNLLGVVLMSRSTLKGEEKKTTGSKSREGGNLNAFGILLIAMMLGGIAYRGATIMTPAYFELKNQELFQWISAFTDGRLSQNFFATSVTSLIFLLGILGQYAGGKAAERIDPRYCYLLFHAVTVPAAIVMGMVSDMPLVLAAMVYFFFLLGMQPSENTLVVRYTPSRFHSSAFGAKFILTFGVGALAVKLVKAIEASLGIEPVYFSLAGVSLLLVIVILVLMMATHKDG
jgi:MFS family permease